MTLKPVKLFGGEVIQQLIPEQRRQDIDIDEDVSDEGDKDYVDEDDFSIEEDENDTDYIYPESDESSDEDVQAHELVNERKFINLFLALYLGSLAALIFDSIGR